MFFLHLRRLTQPNFGPSCSRQILLLMKFQLRLVNTEPSRIINWSYLFHFTIKTLFYYNSYLGHLNIWGGTNNLYFTSELHLVQEIQHIYNVWYQIHILQNKYYQNCPISSYLLFNKNSWFNQTKLKRWTIKNLEDLILYI